MLILIQQETYVTFCL